VALKYDISNLEGDQLSLEELERSKRIKEDLIKIIEEKRKMFPATKIYVKPTTRMTMDDIQVVFREFAENIVHMREIIRDAWIITFSDETILKKVLSGGNLEIEACNCM